MRVGCSLPENKKFLEHLTQKENKNRNNSVIDLKNTLLFNSLIATAALQYAPSLNQPHPCAIF
jgi:hypothetical protein